MLINFLIIFFLIFTLIYLFIKILFKIICLKYNCIIKFQIEKFYKIKNLQIKSKLNKFNIQCSEIWLSNSYFNRNYKMLTVCVNNLHVKYKSNLYEETATTTTTTTATTTTTRSSNRVVNSSSLNVLKYLKFISINIQNTQLEIITFKKLKFYFILVKNINLSYLLNGGHGINFEQINLSLTGLNLKSFYINQNDILFNYLLEDKNDVKLINEIKSFFHLTCVDLSVELGFVRRGFVFNSVKFYLDQVNFNVNENVIDIVKILMKRKFISDVNSSDANNSHGVIGGRNSGGGTMNRLNLSDFAQKFVVFNLKNFNLNLMKNKFEMNELELRQSDDSLELSPTTATADAKLIKLSIKNVYYTKYVTKVLILKKFLTSINFLKNNINISSLCEQTNFFVNLNLIQNFLDELLLIQKTLQKPTLNATQPTATTTPPSTPNRFNLKNLIKKRQLFFEIKCLSSYSTFYLLKPSLNSYIYGCKMLLFKYSSIKTQFSNDKHIEFILNNLILTTTSNFKNYFLQSPAPPPANVHYYSTILNVNKIELKYQLSLNKSYLSLNSDLANIEYSNDYTALLLDKLTKYEKLIEYFIILNFKKILHIRQQRQQQQQQEAKVDADVKINFKIINLLFKFNKNFYFLLNMQDVHYKNGDLSVNRLNLMRHLCATATMMDIDECFLHELCILNVNTINLINKLENLIYLNLIDFKLNYTFAVNLIVFKCWENFERVFQFFNLIFIKNNLNILLKSTSHRHMQLNIEQHNDKETRRRLSKFNLIIENEFVVNFIFNFGEDASTHSTSEQIVTIRPQNFYLFLNTNKFDFKLNCTQLNGYINSMDNYFLSITDFSLVYLHKDLSLFYERKFIKTQLEVNKLLKVNMNTLNIKFFYNYNFAKLIDHILNLRKCMILLGNRNVAKSQLHLSSDVLIKINDFKLEIDDDPFEVKLSYNYALMVDEHYESVKRRQQLDERRVIKENNLEYAAYEILKEREASVYLQRSKKLYGRPTRTQLFTIHVTDFNFYAIADYKWHGPDNCVKFIKAIDPFSPLPSNPKYCLLWHRYVNFTANEFKFILRDYLHPLLHFQNFHLWGNMLVAELEPVASARRDIKLKFQHSNQEYTVMRTMSPLKFYHDLSSKMSLFTYAYGPCKEGCMAQINCSIDEIIHPTRDPTVLPLPWWDKVRLYLHGRLSIQTEQMHIIYHVSMDPYNRTEEMKWVWTDLYFDWYNSKMLFKGNLDVYLNTASKYDDCIVLSWPDLEMHVNIEWFCKKTVNPHGHNYVMLCAPDKSPNPSKHDSFANYRSTNLNLNLSFNCSKTATTTNSPTLKFYASTLRFLQRIKDHFTSVTRPTKRGKLFDNLKPRKPLLSRHYKNVTTLFNIPKLNIVYWSSASEQYGIQLECKKFYFESTHRLHVVTTTAAGVTGAAFIRRAQANWNIESMRYRTTKTMIYLMSPSNEHKLNVASFSTSSSSTASSSSDYNIDNDLIMENERSIKFLDSKPALRNFFLQVDMISYNRENKIENGGYNAKKKSTTSTHEANDGFDEASNMTSSITTAIGSTTSTSTTATASRRRPSMPVASPTLPLHKVQIKNLKAKWNNINRDVIFTLYDIYSRAKLLRHNLSTQALRHFVFESSSSSSANGNDLDHTRMTTTMTMNGKSQDCSTVTDGSFNTSHTHRLDSTDSSFVSNTDVNMKDSYIEEMLEKLEAERGINSEIYTDEKAYESMNFSDYLYGVHAATKMNDILHQNIHIELINCQVKMNLQQILNSSSNPKIKKKTTMAAKLNDNNPDAKPKTQQNDYLIISAAKANLYHRIHKPVFKSQRLLDKFTWTGHVESMQYYATLRTEQDPTSELNLDNDYWLDASIIDPNESEFSNSSNRKDDVFENKNDFFGLYCPKNPLGMIITPKTSTQKYVDSSLISTDEQNTANDKPKLQLIVSKCRCEFYWVDFNDKILMNNENVDENLINTENLLDLNSSFKEPIDCFTLIHYDLNLSTSPKQYKIIMDIVNNLVLYFRPKRKQVLDRQKSIKFNLQLSGDIDSLKQHIQQQQIDIKELLSKLRLLERQLFYSSEKIETEKAVLQQYGNSGNSGSSNSHKQTQVNAIQELKNENKILEKDYKECKQILSELSDELNIAISCYKELVLEKRLTDPILKSRIISDDNSRSKPGSSDTQNTSKHHQTQNKKQNRTSKSFVQDEYTQKSIIGNDIGRRYEIWFKHTQWKLTESDGLMGCAQFTMKNFLYTKLVNQIELDCVEHNLEIGSCRIQDLTPDQLIYNDVLNGQFPSETTADNNTDIDYNTLMFRIFCKERPPVGEIPVIEHLELNLAPLSIKLTHRFYLMMMKFFFPIIEMKKNDVHDGSSGTLVSTATTTASTTTTQDSFNDDMASFDIYAGNSDRQIQSLDANQQIAEYLIIQNLQYQQQITQLQQQVQQQSQSQQQMQLLPSQQHKKSKSFSNNFVLQSNSFIDLQNDDVEIMKQRSANNKTFICIKIPEIPLEVSYKGNTNKKDIKDLNNVSLIFPLFEVYNKTWTWLDLINALKSHIKKALVSQAIKHKLIKIPIKPVNRLISRTRAKYMSDNAEEYEKLKMLKILGARFIEKKSTTTASSSHVATMQRQCADDTTCIIIDKNQTVNQKKLFLNEPGSSDPGNNKKNKN